CRPVDFRDTNRGRGGGEGGNAGTEPVANHQTTASCRSLSAGSSTDARSVTRIPRPVEPGSIVGPRAPVYGSKGPRPIWSRTVTTGGFVSAPRFPFAPSTTGGGRGSRAR